MYSNLISFVSTHLPRFLLSNIRVANSDIGGTESDLEKKISSRQKCHFKLAIPAALILVQPVQVVILPAEVCQFTFKNRFQYH